ncbi:MAG: PAS domain-containing protein, partial [Myxococcota bacterium]
MAASFESPTLLLATDDSAFLAEAQQAVVPLGWQVVHAPAEGELWAHRESCKPALVMLALGADADRPRLCREAVTRFREEPVPVIVAMQELGEALIDSAYAAGAADVVGQPVRWQTVLPRVERMLAAPAVRIDEPQEPAGAAGELAAIRAELERSRLTLQTVQRIAGLGTWTYDFRSGAMSWSNQTYEILGLPPGDVATFESLSLCLHPRDRERVVDTFMSATAGGEGLALICRVVISSGGVRHVQIRGEQPNDGTTVMQGTLQDVTEQQRSQEKIRQLAHFDGLTGLANRRRFMDQLKKAS